MNGTFKTLTSVCFQMSTVRVLKEAEEDQVQIQVAIPNQEDLTEQRRVIMCHQDKQSSKTKARKN